MTDGAASIAAWRSRPVGVAVGSPAAKGKSGLEVLQGIISGEMANPSICWTLNYWLTEAAPGRAVFEGEPNEAALNPMGAVHGGWALTVVDSACGCAGLSVLEPGVGYTTIETKVNMVRAIQPGSGLYRCEARVLAQGRTIITTDATVRGPEGKLYAHGTSTLLVLKG